MGTFREMITERIGKRGVSELARKVGVSPSTLTDYLNRAEPKLTPFVLYRILKETGLDLTDLFECTARDQFEFEFSDKVHRDDPAMLGLKLQVIAKDGEVAAAGFAPALTPRL